MTSPLDYVRGVASQIALEMAPPLIRADLVAESEFRNKHGFKSDAEIVFRKSGSSFQRSVLFKAIRRVLSGMPETDVVDSNDCRWRLRNESEKNRPHLVLSSGKKRMLLVDFLVLSTDREVRLRSLDEAAERVNLPGPSREAWRSVLTDRELADEEVEPYQTPMIGPFRTPCRS